MLSHTYLPLQQLQPGSVLGVGVSACKHTDAVNHRLQATGPAWQALCEARVWVCEFVFGFVSITCARCLYIQLHSHWLQALQGIMVTKSPGLLHWSRG